MPFSQCCRMSLPSAAGGAQHPLDDACSPCGQCLHGFGFSGAELSLETPRCKIHFEMGSFTPSFLLTLSVVPDFEETVASVLEGYCSLPLNSMAGKDWLSLLQAHTDTTMLPMCRADVKCADKSIFLWVQINCFIDRHEVNGKNPLFCQDTSLSQCTWSGLLSVWLWLFKVGPIHSSAHSTRCSAKILDILCYWK